MNWFRKTRTVYGALLRKKDLDAEMDEEMRAHIEMLIQQNLNAGMSAQEARHAALRRFGWTESIQEICRDQRGAGWIENFVRDIRHGCRIMCKDPGFSAVAVLVLALGIGGTSSILDLIYSTLLTPPSYPNPDRIVLILPFRPDGQPKLGCTTGEWLDWQKQTKSFVAIAAYDNSVHEYLLLPDGIESGTGLQVTPSYFDVLGIKPYLGRLFTEAEAPHEDDGQNATVVLLGYELWQRRFNGDPNIIGKAIHFTRRPPVAVIGVMPPGQRSFHPQSDFNPRMDYWLPISAAPTDRTGRFWWGVIGRLRESATLAQAQAEMDVIAGHEAESERILEGVRIRLQPLIPALNRTGRRILLPLVGAVTLMFIIACANVAGLMLARGLRRQHEYAVRSVLGARRAQLFRQVLVENLVLALLAGAIGSALAVAVVKILVTIGGSAIPRLDAVTINWPILGFSFGSAVLSAALAGIIPAVRASLEDPVMGLKGCEGHSSSTGVVERRLLRSVVVLQTSLTLALLVGAGLLVRTVRNFVRLNPGYQTVNILTMMVTSPQGYNHQLALERISALPGVQSAAFGFAPWSGDMAMFTVRIQDQPDVGGAQGILLPTRFVTPQFFETLGLGIVAGRGFRPSDQGVESPFRVVINEAMVKRYFANANPIGKRLVHRPQALTDFRAEIIGVVSSARTEDLSRDPGPEMYLCTGGGFSTRLVIRATTDASALAGTVQKELRAIDPTMIVEKVETLEQIRRDSVAGQIFAMRLLVGFSFTGAVLALVGIYALLSFWVHSRQRELAIRIALGACSSNVLGLVLAEGFRLMVVGVIGGMALTVVLARFLRAFLFGVQPTDPVTLLGVAILFTVVALLACWLPARRASNIDPLIALRSE